jgi:ferrous iron transport protein B
MTATIARRIALVGNPNCGKTALFNALTGARQKVANYPGVTVERKEGHFTTPHGLGVTVIDLPGTYSLRARSPDEAVSRDIVLGRLAGEAQPDLMVVVADATNLRLVLRLVIELRRLGRPMLLALNMMDLANHRGLDIDLAALSRELGMPVVETVAVRRGGIDQLLHRLDGLVPGLPRPHVPPAWREPGPRELREQAKEAQRILDAVVRRRARPDVATDRIDRVMLHPVLGILFLLAVMFLVFQAVFAGAQPLIGLIAQGFDALRAVSDEVLPDGFLRSLVGAGVIGGVGAVVQFLPQIVILFLFIALLEDSGYLARAAFLMDRIMGAVGLHGRAFIPLLSSFACAIPGIMATRVIENPRDRLATTLVAPLMTCSARIPVYTLIIGAFVPDTELWGMINLQGLVLFALFAAGIVSALAMAFVLKRTICRGAVEPLMMELPGYKWPDARNVAHTLVLRSGMFLTRAGTVILALMVVVWFVASFPQPPAGAIGPAIDYSLAGMVGHALQPFFAPLGFDWRITVALIAGLPAREVMIGVLGTVFSLSGDKEMVASALGSVLSQTYTLPTALALLAWYVYAPQCLATISVVRREAGGWSWALFLFVYSMVLAYGGAWAVFQISSRLMAG